MGLTDIYVVCVKDTINCHILLFDCSSLVSHYQEPVARRLGAVEFLA